MHLWLGGKVIGTEESGGNVAKGPKRSERVEWPSDADVLRVGEICPSTAQLSLYHLLPQQFIGSSILNFFTVFFSPFRTNNRMFILLAPRRTS